MTDSSTEPAIERIREYFAAFVRGDAEACAEQWVYPACVYARGRWSALPNAEACRESNDRELCRARDRGMTDGRILELTARAEGRDAAWVEGRFSHEGLAGRVIAEARAAYLVVRTAAGWRVAVCVVKE